VIDLVPAGEAEPAAKARLDKRRWLAERGYRVLDVAAHDVEGALQRVLADLEAQLAHAVSKP
jgi:hypothetical protein